MFEDTELHQYTEWVSETAVMKNSKPQPHFNIKDEMTRRTKSKEMICFMHDDDSCIIFIGDLGLGLGLLICVRPTNTPCGSVAQWLGRWTCG